MATDISAINVPAKKRRFEQKGAVDVVEILLCGRFRLPRSCGGATIEQGGASPAGGAFLTKPRDGSNPGRTRRTARSGGRHGRKSGRAACRGPGRTLSVG